MDDKKEGIISTAQDAVVGTVKAGWEGAKDLAETATSAVTDAVAGVAKKRPARRKKAKTAAAKTAGARKQKGSASSRGGARKSATKKKPARKAGSSRRTPAKSQGRRTRRSR
jgi:hypothetical protein